MTGRSPEASRQALRRARSKLALSRPEVKHPQSEAKLGPVATSLLEATASGDISRLLSVLAPDVALVSDGGGLVRSINRPLVVARLFLAMADLAVSDTRVETTSLNGQPAFLIFKDGALTNAFLLEQSAAGLTAIYVIRSPKKPRWLARTIA